MLMVLAMPNVFTLAVMAIMSPITILTFITHIEPWSYLSYVKKSLKFFKDNLVEKVKIESNMLSFVNDEMEKHRLKVRWTDHPHISVWPQYDKGEVILNIGWIVALPKSKYLTRKKHYWENVSKRIWLSYDRYLEQNHQDEAMQVQDNDPHDLRGYLESQGNDTEVIDQLFRFFDPEYRKKVGIDRVVLSLASGGTEFETNLARRYPLTGGLGSGVAVIASDAYDGRYEDFTRAFNEKMLRSQHSFANQKLKGSSVNIVTIKSEAFELLRRLPNKSIHDVVTIAADLELSIKLIQEFNLQTNWTAIEGQGTFFIIPFYDKDAQILDQLSSFSRVEKQVIYSGTINPTGEFTRTANTSYGSKHSLYWKPIGVVEKYERTDFAMQTVSVDRELMDYNQTGSPTIYTPVSYDQWPGWLTLSQRGYQINRNGNVHVDSERENYSFFDGTGLEKVEKNLKV